MKDTWDIIKDSIDIPSFDLDNKRNFCRNKQVKDRFFNITIKDNYTLLIQILKDAFLSAIKERYGLQKDLNSNQELEDEEEFKKWKYFSSKSINIINVISVFSDVITNIPIKEQPAIIDEFRQIIKQTSKKYVLLDIEDDQELKASNLNYNELDDLFKQMYPNQK